MKQFVFILLFFTSISAYQNHLRDDILLDDIPRILDDENQDGFHDLKQFNQIFKNRQMTNGEIKLVFRTADVNSNNKVEKSEWIQFWELFVKPFQRLDLSNKYLVDEIDLMVALEEEFLSNVKLRDDDIKDLVAAFDRFDNEFVALGGQMNFADYIFIRKANLAWKECTRDNFIGVNQIACGLHITSSNKKTISRDEAKQVFEMGLILIYGNTYNINVNNLDFVGFVTIAHLYHYFTEYGIPFFGMVLKKRDMINAVNEFRLPSTITPGIINDMFGDLKQLDFKAFAGMFYCYRYYSRMYSGNNHLDKYEFTLFFNRHEKFVESIHNLIEEFPRAEQETTKEAALRRKTPNYSEKDFLTHFLQTNSKLHHKRHHKYHNKKAIENFRMRFTKQFPFDKDPVFEIKNEDVIFRLFDSRMTGELKFIDFMKFIKYSWAFQDFDTDSKGLLDDQHLMDGTRRQSFIIPFWTSEKQDVLELTDWLADKRSYKINIKQFFAWMRAKDIFEANKIISTHNHVIETKLHQAFRYLGIRLNNETEFLNHDSYEKDLGDKAFNYKQTFQYALEDEIIAIKIQEGQDDFWA